MKKEGKKFAVIFGVFAFALASIMLANIASSQSPSAESVFFTSAYTCYKNTSSAIWGNIASEINETAYPGGNCSKYYAAGFMPACCPIDYECNFTSGSCYIGTVRLCSQLLDSASCSSASSAIAKDSIEKSSTCGHSDYFYPSGLKCVNVTDCTCYWNSSLNGGTCLGMKNYTMSCDPSLGGTVTPIGECIWLPAEEYNKCNSAENIITISSVAQWFSSTGAAEPDDCTNFDRIYPCVSTAKLDFWNNFSIAALIALMAGVYFYLAKREYL